jgi:hypothetical protein
LHLRLVGEAGARIQATRRGRSGYRKQ